jgi:TonB family protein
VPARANPKREPVERHRVFTVLFAAAAGLLLLGSTETDVPIVPLWRMQVIPQLVNVPAPAYPVVARKAGIEGQTTVEVLVDTNGTVINARTLKSSGNSLLDASAIDAARSAKYTPGMSRGQAVRGWTDIPFEFRIPQPGSAAAIESGRHARPEDLELSARLRSGSVLLKPCFFRIEVTDSVTGAPVDYRGSIYAIEWSPGMSLDISAGRINYVPAAGCSMLVKSPLYVTTRLEAHLVEHCTTSILVRLVSVSTTGTDLSIIRGRVVDAAVGEPIIWCPVTVDTYPEVHTDTGGCYVIQVASGRHRVCCLPTGYQRGHPRSVRTARNQVATLDFALKSGDRGSDSALRLLRGANIVHLLDVRPYASDSASLRYNDSLQVAAWHVYQSGRGRMAIRSYHGTVEGDPIVEYTLIDNGRATFIMNTLSDQFGRRQVRATPLVGLLPVCRVLEAGLYVEREFSEENRRKGSVHLKPIFTPGRHHF